MIASPSTKGLGTCFINLITDGSTSVACRVGPAILSVALLRWNLKKIFLESFAVKLLTIFEKIKMCISLVSLPSLGKNTEPSGVRIWKEYRFPGGGGGQKVY